MMRAMILAAGHGERLKPLTDELPKPAVPIGHRPAVWYALDCLYQHGIREATINTFHLAGEIRRHLDPHVPSGMRVHYLQEQTLLGTAGGLRNAYAQLLSPTEPDSPVVVFNGKLVFFPDLQLAVAEHNKRRAFATMILRHRPPASAYGLVEIDAQSRVRRILGDPQFPLADARATMFTGVHLLSADALKQLPAQGCIIRDGYLRWLEEGRVIHGHVSHAPWNEVSTVADYHAANMALIDGHIQWPGLASPRPIHASAEISAGAKITHSFVGAHSVVADGVVVDRCVVWPNSHVRASAIQAIITPRITLHPPNALQQP